jgi:hypothetical protein
VRGACSILLAATCPGLTRGTGAGSRLHSPAMASYNSKGLQVPFPANIPYTAYVVRPRSRLLYGYHLGLIRIPGAMSIFQYEVPKPHRLVEQNIHFRRVNLGCTPCFDLRTLRCIRTRSRSVLATYYSSTGLRHVLTRYRSSIHCMQQTRAGHSAASPKSFYWLKGRYIDRAWPLVD